MSVVPLSQPGNTPAAETSSRTVQGRDTWTGDGLRTQREIPVVIEYKPSGYNAYTSIGWVGFLGVQTGFNAGFREVVEEEKVRKMLRRRYALLFDR
jgi:hypothetical protein